MDFSTPHIQPDPSWPPWLIAIAVLAPIVSGFVNNWLTHVTIQKSLEHTTDQMKTVENGAHKQAPPSIVVLPESDKPKQ